MRTFILIPAILTICLLSSDAMAIGGSGTGRIDVLYQRSSDGLLAVYKGGSSFAPDWDNPDGCDASDRFVITRENKSCSEWYTTLLFAKVNLRQIKARFDGCITWNGVSYPEAVGLYLY